MHGVVETFGVLAQQFGNVQPEAPPIANGIERVLRWFMWFTQLSGLSGITYAGGKFAWEKWHGGALESPKMVAGAALGGLTAASAGTIMNSVVLTQ